MIATLPEVASFLSDFKAKLSVYDVVYLNREKNLRALAELDILPSQRTRYLKGLGIENYYKGPLKEKGIEDGLWEFGARVNRSEVYIKIQLGLHNRSTICVSFHLAEFPISYSYKTDQ